MDNQEEIFPVVNEQGEVIGKITRGQAHDGTKILHPVVHLHVFNSKGDLYLQHRPGMEGHPAKQMGHCDWRTRGLR